MDGVSKLVALMPGAGFTVQTMMLNVVAVSSVLPTFGAHQLIRQITASKYGGLSKTAPPGRPIETGMPT
jgi:hypothetical protein